MMPLDLACPHCGEPVAAAEPEGSCPYCGTQLSSPIVQDREVATTEPPSGESLDNGEGVGPIERVSDSDAPALDVDSSIEPDVRTEGESRAAPSGHYAEIQVSDSPAEESAFSFAPGERAAVSPVPGNASAGEPWAPKGVSRRLFVLVLTYAVSVTILLGLLLYMVRTGKPHQLESLPDIVPNYRETLPDVPPPLNKQGEVIRQIVPADAELPAGHTLRLGQSERFGNVRVTPLKVTREMLQFAHYSGETDHVKPPVGPVLKLWLSFENVSDEQMFAPLDRQLLYFRGRTSENSFEFRANNFLAGADRRSDAAVLVYDLVLEDDWDPRDQSLGTDAAPRLLEPGDRLVTYIPTQPEGINELPERLVWRVHFRKGYNPETGHGVTTLIEVVFNADQIESGI